MTINPQLKTEVLGLLGGDWPKTDSVGAEIVELTEAEGFKREHVRIHTASDDVIPAIVLLPLSANGSKPTAAVAVWHQHNAEFHLGKSEPAGLSGSKEHHSGAALVREGYIVICPDAIGFEERRDTKIAGAEYERHLFSKFILEGKSLAWKNILDMKTVLSYLSSRPEVDPLRIGSYGHSLGATFSWLLSPWEERLKCVVANCALPSLKVITEDRIEHSLSNIIPGLSLVADTADFFGMGAPRPLHLNFGAHDHINPVKYVPAAVRRIKEWYREPGSTQTGTQSAEANVSVFVDDSAGHTESPAMWQQTLRLFKKHL